LDLHGIRNAEQQVGRNDEAPVFACEPTALRDRAIDRRRRKRRIDRQRPRAARHD
jgi:hypothetical protein